MAKDIDHKRVLESVEHSRSVLEKYRQLYRDRVALYAGADYATDAGMAPRPLNFIRQYIDIFGRQIVAKNPRCMWSTFTKKQKPAVRAMQDWMNKHVERIDLQGVLSRSIINGMFQIGVTKVALANKADAAASAYGIEPGDPYACSISIMNLVYDVFGETEEGLQYVGHWVRVPVDAVKDSKLFGPGRKELEPTEKRQFTPDGDEMANTLSGWASKGTKTEAYPSVDLLELYFPREKKWVTYGSDGAGMARLYKDGPLREADWIGPRCGPFHFFKLGHVPDNFMPAGTVAPIVDLDISANDIFRKLWRQSQRAKQLDLVEAGATEDAKAIREARDGDIIPVSRQGVLQKVTTGGPMPELVAFLGVVRELFNFMAGNPAAVGGLAAQADTAKQEQLMAQSASAGVRDMQGDAVRHVKSVMNALGWFYWENPFKVMRTEYRRKGLEPVPRRLYPGGAVSPENGRKRVLTRDIPFEELDVRLDPFSISYQTPAERAMKLRTMFTQLIAPIMPMLQQQGLSWDMAKFMQNLGEYEDEPDYAEFLNIEEPVDPATLQGEGGQQSGSGMPINTTRTYERKDTGKGAPDAFESASQMMASARPSTNGSPQ